MRPFREIALGALTPCVSWGLVAALEAGTVPRLNRIIALLEAGDAVFGVFSGDKTPESAVSVSGLEGADFVFYSMETGPFDVPRMQVYMQFLLDRGDLVRHGTLENPLPLVARLPPIRDGYDEARERTEALLDAGAYGVVYPHVGSAKEAAYAVATMRSGGRGGWAPRYWGVGEEDYRRRADVWPLDPRGELLAILIVEDRAGIENVRAIAATEGVGILFAGPGDLSRAYEGDPGSVERAIGEVLAACLEFDVPCGVTAGPEDIEKRLQEGFRVIITGEEALAIGRRAAGRS